MALATLLAQRWSAKRPGAPLKVHVVPGRQDHETYFEGNWSEWQHGVVERRRSSGKKPLYDLFIARDHQVGRATASILDHALDAKRPVFWWNGASPDWPETAPKPKLNRVVDVAEEDPDDWTAGWSLEIKGGTDG